MRDIILVPTYMRPEYLFLCLERIHNAERPLDAEIWICQDFRFEDQHRHALGIQWTTEVLDYWRGKLPIRFIQRRPHGFEGNSRNVLEAYKEAAATDARYIYLIEDDVLVQPDFFKWHEAVQADGDFMCSVAYRCSRNSEARTDIADPSAYFTSARDYASVGVCWRAGNLIPVVQHATDEYYRDTSAYMQRTFPGNRFAGDFSEQDGLIMRCLWEARPARIAWPYVPRCYHMGFYGYHRPDGKRPDGLLNDKIAKLRGIIHSAEKIKTVSFNFDDIEPMPIGPNPPFEKLYCVQDFE